MSNKISYFVPKSAIGSKINFKLGAVNFRRQFEAGTTPSSPLNVGSLGLAAVNCGYGAVPAELFSVSPSPPWWPALTAYFQARLTLLTSLITTTGTRTYSSIPLEHLETTEKGDASYLFGMLFCRVATDQWVQDYMPMQTVTNFWHLRVAKNSAASLWAVTRPWGKDVQNPDFIFQLKNGDWYSIEAKGTFEDERWTLVQDGLLQANKITRINYIDLSSATATRKSKKITNYACTLAYFDAKNELQVIHADPVVKNSGSSLFFVPEFAELVRYEQAFSQYEVLGRMNTSQRSWMDVLDGADWRLMFDGQNRDMQCYVGMPVMMKNIWLHLRLALSVLRVVMPRISILFTSNTTVELRREGRAELLSELKMKMQEDLNHRSVWNKVIKAIQKIGEEEKMAEQEGTMVLDTLYALKFLPPIDTGDSSIKSLLAQFEKVKTTMKGYLDLKAKLEQKDTLSSYTLDMSDHGLLIFTGTLKKKDVEIFKKHKL